MRNPFDSIHNDRIISASTLITVSLALIAGAGWAGCLLRRRKTKTVLAAYEEARRRLDATAVLRHDYRKHLNIVRRMLADGQTERAQAYLDSLLDKAGRELQAADTGNYMIDLILNSRLAAARESGACVRVKAVGIPDTLHIPDDELSALLGNALDNAVAAAGAAGEGGWIDIDLHVRGQMLYIGISNSCSDPSAASSGKTRRKGYGQMIMQKIVERYQGMMDTESKGGSYRVSFLLPVIA